MASYRDVQDTLNNLTFGGRPLALAGLGSAVLGGLGYTMGPRLAMGVLGRLPGAGPRGFRSREQYEQAKKRMGVLGAALGAAPGLYLTGQNIGEKGLSGLWKKSFDKEARRDLGERLVKRADTVDYFDAVETVSRDPFLGPEDKRTISDIFNNAHKKSKSNRLLTTEDVVKGAVGAGFGWGGAALAGPVITKLFSLPKGTQRKLSNAGMLAGGLWGSNIIQ